MARFGMIGPSYASQSLTADCQITKNWYPEAIESSMGKAAMALYPTPGTSFFTFFLSGGPIRAQLEINGRAFAITGNYFVEIFANGTFAGIAPVTDDNLPASMVASPQQILIASGGALYVYWLDNMVVGTTPPR